jgi:hypothetical protein
MPRAKKIKSLNREGAKSAKEIKGFLLGIQPGKPLRPLRLGGNYF